jgi:hypothetical protein
MSRVAFNGGLAFSFVERGLRNEKIFIRRNSVFLDFPNE